jgi:ribosomal protein L17
MLTNANEKGQKRTAGYKCKCGKEYKHKSTLSRHKTECLIIVNNIDTTNGNNVEDKKLINKLIDANNDLTNKIVELAKEPKTINNTTNNTNNTTNNMTINVFLNEKCKDAINLVDFIKNMNITWDDTTQTKDICLEESLTNLIMDKVKDMDITERPIHCTDKRRLQYYIKDGEWKSQDIDYVFDKVLYDISNRHRQNLLDYCDDHPGWMQADENTDMYFGVSQGSFLYRREMPKRINKVKKLLSDKVMLKKEDIK